MKKLFGSSSALFKFMTVLWELAEIGILFLVGSLPIVTIGAAYTAMQGSLYDMQVHGEGCFTARQFWNLYKKSLKPMVPLWCLGALGMAGLAENAGFVLSNMQGTGRLVLVGFYFVMFLLIFGTMQYTGFLVARAGAWKGIYLKNGFLMALAKFPSVIVCAVLTGSVLSVLLLTGACVLRLLPLIVLFWFSCPAYVCAGILAKRLEPFFPELFEDELREE